MDDEEFQLSEGLLFGQHKTHSPDDQRLCLNGLRALVWGSIALFLAFLGMVLTISMRPTTPSHPGHGSWLPVPVAQQRKWAQYSPYNPVATYTAPPKGCHITQVNILQRHGARFPTSGATRRILSAVEKIKSASEYRDRALKFLETYEYDLGIDDLTPYGADEAFRAGAEAFSRYHELVDANRLPFIRSDISQRDIDSANNWTAGFAVASRSSLHPTLAVILDSATNDTLDDSQCPAAGSSKEQTDTWLARFAPPLTAWINDGAPNANLTDQDILSLISLCPFHTIASQKKSPWCKFFDSFYSPFRGFEYSGDLDKYYKTGYGQRLGPVQGVGYINELLARLTESPVQDRTQTNHTLDDDPTTFPLNRTVYIDFSHDNQMIAIFSAMGLYRQPAPLDPLKPDPDRTWRVSSMVPFSGRMVVERLECIFTGQMIRILVQDEIQPLDFCRSGSGGLCSVDAFVESQAYARYNGEGDWEKCSGAQSP